LIYFIFRDIEFFPLTLSCFEFAEALGKTASGNQSLQTVIDNTELEQLADVFKCRKVLVSGEAIFTPRPHCSAVLARQFTSVRPNGRTDGNGLASTAVCIARPILFYT